MQYGFKSLFLGSAFLALFSSAPAFSAQKIDCMVFGGIGTYENPGPAGFISMNGSGRPTARYSHPLNEPTQVKKGHYMIRQEFTAIASNAVGTPTTYRYDVTYNAESKSLSVGVGNPLTGAGAKTEGNSTEAPNSRATVVLIGDQSADPRGLNVGASCTLSTDAEERK